MTEFLFKIRDVIHGWSEETRKFLALAAMSVVLIAVFSIWISSVSSRLVAIGPSAPATPGGQETPAPTASLPSEDNLGPQDNSIAQVPGYVPSPSVPAQPEQNPLPIAHDQPAQAPTPIQGVAETFGGLNQLFRTTDSSNSFSLEGLWRVIMRVFAAIDGFLRMLGGFLYHKASTLIAS